ncbi:MAG TPA: hypothetical protein VLA09_03360 [Longimicrobiales bacterium]|nr:hypothetical protein [Longimicrobiales bacterium]
MSEEWPMTQDFATSVKERIAQAVKGHRKDLAWPRRLLWWLVASKVNREVDRVVGQIEREVGSPKLRAYDLAKTFWNYSKDVKERLEDSESCGSIVWVPIAIPINSIHFERTRTVLVEHDWSEIGRIDLQVDLDLTPKGFKFGIKDGRLAFLNPGVCDVKGSFKFRITDGLESTDEAWSPPIDIPPFDEGPLELPMGVDIPIEPIALPAETMTVIPWDGQERRIGQRRAV